MTKKRKRFTKYCLIAILFIPIWFGVKWAWKYYRLPVLPDSTAYETLTERAVEALEFAREHNMSENYALFVDYSIPSGTPRLYVWDFKQKRITARSYVMHGSGKGSTAEQPIFSNMSGSNCSSLGRFLVTKEHGKYTRSFRIKGLDWNNQTAYARGLMIHPAKWVNRWCWKEYIPLNSTACRGCVTVSSRGMDEISALVNKESKPILLWNYYKKAKEEQ